MQTAIYFTHLTNNWLVGQCGYGQKLHRRGRLQWCLLRNAWRPGLWYFGSSSSSSISFRGRFVTVVRVAVMTRREYDRGIVSAVGGVRDHSRGSQRLYRPHHRVHGEVRSVHRHGRHGRGEMCEKLVKRRRRNRPSLRLRSSQDKNKNKYSHVRARVWQ